MKKQDYEYIFKIFVKVRNQTRIQERTNENEKQKRKICKNQNRENTKYFWSKSEVPKM